ncbi:hydrolase [Phenylobacterium sp.]|uniref:hydrolase n=1 Tax=Phenylobacterium sp. TaxID=1871053 RepID=UPI002E344F51|nr:hydrolase [Phenylobacterium sp.]HEX3366462.1 hydrolase [Phenylobacterium sp.]
METDAAIRRKDALMITLPALTTALILIDLQKGIVGLPLAPYSGDAVVAKGMDLARRFRAAKAPVVLVNVAFAPDFSDALNSPVDEPPQMPSGGFPEGWTELIDGLAEPSDLRVTKRQWGAFYGTELDLQLRRRGVTAVVIGGVATNMGVESTARAAHEHGYAVVLAEDATTGRSADMHTFAFEQIFPKIGRVAKADDIVLQA